MLRSQQPGTPGLVVGVVMLIGAVIAVLVIFSGTTRWIVLGALVLLNALGLPSRIRRAKQTPE